MITLNARDRQLRRPSRCPARQAQNEVKVRRRSTDAEWSQHSRSAQSCAVMRWAAETLQKGRNSRAVFAQARRTHGTNDGRSKRTINPNLDDLQVEDQAQPAHVIRCRAAAVRLGSSSPTARHWLAGSLCSPSPPDLLPAL